MTTIPLHLSQEIPMSTQRRIRTIQQTEYPIALGDPMRASDIAAIITASEADAQKTDNAGPVWARLDQTTAQLVIGFTVETLA